MKKILALFALLYPLVASAQYGNFSLGFDGNDSSAWLRPMVYQIDATQPNNIWQVGRPQKTRFAAALMDSNSIVTDTLNPYPINDTSSFVVYADSADVIAIFAYQWMQRLDLEAGKDFAMVEFSIDSGATWQNAFDNPYVYNFYGFSASLVDTMPSGQLAFTGTSDTFPDYVWFCIDAYWPNAISNSSWILLRFTLLSDSIDTQQDGWIIDNFALTSTRRHPIANITQQEYLRAYPNPVCDRLYIDLKHHESAHWIEEMELINMQGQVVQRWTKIPSKFFIDVRPHAPGLYQLRVRSNLRTETVPIVIERG